MNYLDVLTRHILLNKITTTQDVVGRPPEEGQPSQIPRGTRQTTINYDRDNEERIQEILWNCYDLQILYLIKHIEVMELFRLILYYLDILYNSIIIVL